MLSSTTTTLLLLLLFVSPLASAPLPQHLHKIPLRFTPQYVYYASLSVGSKGQQMEMLLDSGSRTMAMFCDTCHQGCILQQQLKTSQSRTFKEMTCDDARRFVKNGGAKSNAVMECLEECELKLGNYVCGDELSYGSGEFSSYLDYNLVYDQMAVSGSSGVSSTFGCIYKEKDFDQGIWGVSINPDNQFLQMVYKDDIAKGYQAQRLYTICTNGTDSVMNIGAVDQTYHIGEGVSVRADAQYPLWWKLVDNDIGQWSFDGVIVKAKGTSYGKYGIILDSGTDMVVLPGAVVDKIQAKIDQLCQKDQNCRKMKPMQAFDALYVIKNAPAFFNSLPPIKVQFSGKILETPVSNYFWKLDDQTWSLSIMPAQKYGFPNSILGSIWMNNFDIVFDREHAQIKIHDIERCSPPAKRLLQEQNDIQEYDPYELPKTRGEVNSFMSLFRVKVKYQKSLLKMKK